MVSLKSEGCLPIFWQILIGREDHREVWMIRFYFFVRSRLYVLCLGFFRERPIKQLDGMKNRYVITIAHIPTDGHATSRTPCDNH